MFCTDLFVTQMLIFFCLCCLCIYIFLKLKYGENPINFKTLHPDFSGIFAILIFLISGFGSNVISHGVYDLHGVYSITLPLQPKVIPNAICGICQKGKEANKKGKPEALIHCSQCQNSGKSKLSLPDVTFLI